MVDKVTAFRAADGQLYETEEKALRAEIHVAAKHLSGCSVKYLADVATGNETCPQTEQAIERLLKEIRSRRRLAQAE